MSGADVELHVDEWLQTLKKGGTKLMLGGSLVNKYEKKEDIFASLTYKYNLPENYRVLDAAAAATTNSK